MPLHLIKLSVGSETLSDLQTWQQARLDDRRRTGRKLELEHPTRHTPKRAEELLDGGSLYWVVKGVIRARQRLIALRALEADSLRTCAIVYDPALIPVSPRAHRPFQGWRYLKPEDAPPDLAQADSGDEQDEMPEELRLKLSLLGLL